MQKNPIDLHYLIFYIYSTRERLAYAIITIDKISHLKELQQCSLKKATNRIFIKYGFEWLLPINVNQKQRIMLAFHGQLKTLQSIYHRNPKLKFCHKMFIAAAKNNHLEIVLWGKNHHNNNNNILPIEISTYFIKHNNLEAIRKLKLHLSWNHEMCKYVGECGNLDLLSILPKPDRVETGLIIVIAAKNGHLNIIKQLYTYFEDFIELYTCGSIENALKYKHYDILIFLCEKNVLSTTFMDLLFKTITKRNELKVLQWAHNFFPNHDRVKRVVHEAYQKKHFELLSWAIRNMVPNSWNITQWKCFQNEEFMKIYTK